jgi:O-antigen/teichoic acid export membrane protein
MGVTPRSATAAFYFLGHVINFLVNFLATPYLARSLSQQEFGIYGQVIMTLDIANLLFSFGLSNSMALALTPTNKDQIESEFATFFALFALMGLVGSAGIFGFSYCSHWVFGHGGNAVLLRWFAICLFFLYLNHGISRVLIYLDRSKRYVVANILGNLLRVFLMVISLYYYQSLWGVVMSVLAAYVLQFLWGAYYVPFSFFKGEIKYRSFGAILHEGYLLAFTYQLQYAYLYITGIFISYYLGLSQYAIYRSSSFELPLVGSLYIAIGAIMFPTLASHIQQGNYEVVLAFKQRVIRQMAVLIYPATLFMVVFSDVFIPLYLSEKYSAGAPIFAIMSLMILTKVTDFADIITMEKNYKTILRLNLLYFALYIGLLIPLTYFVGIMGAAIAIVLSHYYLCYLYLRQTLLGTTWTVARLLNFAHLGLVVLICLIFALACRLVHSYMNNSIAAFLAIGMIYSLLVYVTILRLGWVDLRLYEPIFSRNNYTQWLFRQITRLAK